MVAAALITAGCSSDDDAVETAPELRAISFTGGVNTEEVQTSRAEDEGLEKYSNQFIVYAYKNGNKELVMNGYAVNWIPISAGSTSTNTHDWEYVGQGAHADHPQVIKYWDERPITIPSSVSCRHVPPIQVKLNIIRPESIFRQNHSQTHKYNSLCPTVQSSMANIQP